MVDHIQAQNKVFKQNVSHEINDKTSWNPNRPRPRIQFQVLDTSRVGLLQPHHVRRKCLRTRGHPRMDHSNDPQYPFLGQTLGHYFPVTLPINILSSSLQFSQSELMSQHKKKKTCTWLYFGAPFTLQHQTAKWKLGGPHHTQHFVAWTKTGCQDVWIPRDPSKFTQGFVSTKRNYRPYQEGHTTPPIYPIEPIILLDFIAVIKHIKLATPISGQWMPWSKEWQVNSN